jgi:hypothetical protein
MKLNGKTIEGPTPEVIVIPKGGEEFVIKAMPVLSYDEFDQLCPTPLPPEKILKGGERQLDIKDKDYNAKITDWAEKKNAWMTITSLSATEGIEWETIDMADPETWTGYIKELGQSFTDNECNLIYNLVLTACGLNQEKIDEATKRFLAGQAQAQDTQ